MNDRAGIDYIIIGFTLLIGMILTLLPLPQWVAWVRPNWVLAITIFWLMTASHRIGIGAAWCIGFFMDTLTGTILGEQALVFTITAYIVLKFQHWLAHMPVFQQTAALFMLILFDLIIDRCLTVLLHHTPVDWNFWMTAVTTAVIWPWLSGLLYYCQIKLRIVDLS